MNVLFLFLDWLARLNDLNHCHTVDWQGWQAVLPHRSVPSRDKGKQSRRQTANSQNNRLVVPWPASNKPRNKLILNNIMVHE